MDNDDNPVLKEVEKQMDIVPYTRKDRVVTWTILFVVLGNFVILILSIPWGTLW